VASSDQLIDALKAALKQHGLTYRDLADGLQVSESSVKRWFAERTFTLQRIDSICRLMDLEFSGLLQLARHQSELAETLTAAQEQAMVGDVRLLLVAYLLLHRYTPDQIRAEYRFEETELFRYLARLDRLGVIELLPGNRVRPLIAPNFSWLPHGPIQRYFESRVRQDFLQSDFNAPGEMQRFAYGMLSEEAIGQINRRIERLVREYDTLNQEDRALPLAVRHGTSMLVAFRRWGFSEFDELRRDRAPSS
jgi:transcriptional regulator with XRE-family HTH domain